jgi:pyruvate carboxylase
MALMMVTSGLSRAQVEDPAVEIAFPESVVQFFHGDIGQPYGGFPEALQAKVLKGREPLTVRPGEALPPADLERLRRQTEEKCGRAVTDEEFASALMYPKVFQDYVENRNAFGNVSVLPTHAFFYGMEAGEEISIDIERGKTLFVRFVTVSDLHDDGTRTVFFELNGQPRSVRVRDRSLGVARQAARKADPDNPNHVGAPMPGTVATVAVVVGQKVERGDVLVTLEAMKMEAAVRADRVGEVIEVIARPGQQVDAKDLLVVMA